MKKLIHVDEALKNEIIAGAMERETPCVVTSRAEVGWRTTKLRFVAVADATGRVFVAPQGNGTDATLPVYERGERVGLSFRRGHKKCMCSTAIVEPPQSQTLANGDSANCIELQWPEALQELQRRVYYRATPDRTIQVRFWAGGVAKRADADASPDGIITGTLLDLSAGGMRVKVSECSAGRFAEGDPIGCSFTPKPRQEVLILDATYRHLQPEGDGTRSIGLQFVGLETTERGRETLAKLAAVVTEFQRSHGSDRRRRDLAAQPAGVH